MPVEIRELVIKATIVQENGGLSGGSAPGGDNDVSPNEDIITTCVETILEILKNKNDR